VGSTPAGVTDKSNETPPIGGVFVFLCMSLSFAYGEINKKIKISEAFHLILTTELKGALQSKTRAGVTHKAEKPFREIREGFFTLGCEVKKLGMGFSLYGVSLFIFKPKDEKAIEKLMAFLLMT